MSAAEWPRIGPINAEVTRPAMTAPEATDPTPGEVRLSEAERLGCDPSEIVAWPWSSASPGHYLRTETVERILAADRAKARGQAERILGGIRVERLRAEAAEAEVADLRAKVERVEALHGEWARTHRDQLPHLGCLDMYAHCATLLRAALGGEHE